MSSSEPKQWLQAGIAAVKSGDLAKARRLLSKVVESEERNEQAWLWLSTVVDSEDDRRICLENVLALNPGSKIARQELAKLDSSTIDLHDTLPQESSGTTETSRSVDYSASADEINAPELETGVRVSSRLSDSSFDDVWDTDEDICAYCARKLNEDDAKCPKCGRQLIKKEYRYPATAGLHVFWVFLLTLGLILLFQAAFKLRIEQDETVAIFHILLSGALMLTVVGVYIRFFWAHITSIFILILVLILSVSNFFVALDRGSLGMDGLDVAFQGVATSFLVRTGVVLEVVQVVIAALTLFYAIFRAGPEFDRIEERAIARTEKRLHNAVDYHMAARRKMQQGMWASAILHWQRAVALDSSKVAYQRDLVKAYLRLGFFERGLSILESANSLPMQPGMRCEMDKLMKWAQRHVESRQKDR